MSEGGRSSEGGSRADGLLARRHFLELGVAGSMTLSLGGLPALARSLGWSTDPAPPARSVLHVFLAGGLSHLDTFDPKPYAPVEVRGQLGTIASGIEGARFSELLERTAGVSGHLAVIRSMTHGEAAHERGTHTMLTGYQPSPALTYPSLGSVFAHELGGRNDLPPYVCIPGARDPFLGPGYLSSAHAPFSVGGEPRAPGFRVRDLESPAGAARDRRERRRRLLEGMDARFEAGESADAVAATEAFYAQAWALVDSKSAREAFAIRAEPRKVRERYGMTGIGQRLLLARRLVEGGVRYVMVRDAGYDHHQEIFRGLPARMRDLDQGFAALVGDLAARGLLAETLVVLSTEFGRTSRINADGGRDHWPKVFSVVVAGGGVLGGLIHGASDAEGREPEDEPVSPADLAATIFSQAGIDPTRKLQSPGDRPIDIVREGRVVRELLG